MKTSYPKIALQGIDGLIFVREEDIIHANADGNYTEVILLDQQKVRVLRNLKEVEQLLSSEKFVRTHRSNLINLDHITRYDPENNSVLLSNGDSANVARDRKAEFIDKFTRI